MSAFDEYAEEKRTIDELIGQGFSIAGMYERLDGADVLFVRKSEPEARRKVLLLTAEARKYVSYLVLVQQSEAKAQ
jgi:tRNA isopentenyl-2-thiomethyl-A-37 hydroxylase MiaE